VLANVIGININIFSTILQMGIVTAVYLCAHECDATISFPEQKPTKVNIEMQNDMAGRRQQHVEFSSSSIYSRSGQLHDKK